MTSPLSSLAALDNVLEKSLSVILMLTSIFIVLSVGASAIMRYVIHKDIYGIEELISIAAFWLYFAGAAYCTRQGSHISADMLNTFIKNPAVLRRVHTVKHCITTCLCLLFTWWSWEFFLWGYTEHGLTNQLQLPLWISQIAVFLGFVLMSLYFVVHTVRHLQSPQEAS